MRRTSAILLLALIALAPRSAAAVEFQPTIAAARTREAAATAEARKPIVVAFGSSWCGWCRKMEIDAFASPLVEAVADQFLWVKLDVDEHEDLAAQYEVRGLPHTFVLNGEDRIIASRPGYQDAEQFVAFLEEALTNPHPVEDVLGDLVAALTASGSDEERAVALRGLVEHLAQANRRDRAPAVQAVRQVGRPAWTVLVELLRDERLSVRAAAGGTLAAVTRAEVKFDPFAADEVRQRQVEDWRVWTQAAPPAPPSGEAEPSR